MLRDNLVGSSSRCFAAREFVLSRCSTRAKSHRTIDPHALKIPAPTGAESTLTENVLLHFTLSQHMHGTFVVPTTSREFGYDLGLIWWLFIIWLPWSGFGFGPEPERE
jgi:hypothetical protein